MLEGEPYDEADPLNDRVWSIFPVLVKLDERPKVVLNNENVEYTWVSPSAIDSYDTIPGLELSIGRALELAH